MLQKNWFIKRHLLYMVLRSTPFKKNSKNVDFNLWGKHAAFTNCTFFRFYPIMHLTWHVMQELLNCEHSLKRTQRFFRLKQACFKLNPTKWHGFSSVSASLNGFLYQVKNLKLFFGSIYRRCTWVADLDDSMIDRS